jgi:ectoine hydroxylase-related dioxygenase (phytanoyl-CoA dioxygenase family)
MSTLTTHSIDDTGAAYAARLREDGYCIMPGLVGRRDIAALNDDLDPHFEATPFCKGDFYGETTKRFGSLLKRSHIAETLVRHPAILSLAQSALGPYCDCILLNLTQAVEIHPGAPEQLPHRDQDMWGGAKGEIEYLVNVIWPLVPFTKDNGATVIWQDSHRDQDAPLLPRERALAAEADSGSAIVFLGSTLHAGGANRTKLPRRAIIISYCLGWLRQFEAQMLIYPPNIARRFSTELAELIGYSIHRPNLGNYEGQSPLVCLRSDVPDHLAATDALRPEQAAWLSQYRAQIAAQANFPAQTMRANTHEVIAK